MAHATAFYQLTSDEWCSAWESLKPSEIKVLYYLRTLHPFGGELKLKIAEVAEKLNLNRSTVSRALGKLAREGWIQFQEVSLKLVNTLPPVEKTSEPEPVRSPRTECDRAEQNAIVSSGSVTARSQSVTKKSHHAIATHKSTAEMPSVKQIQNALDLKDPKEEKTTQAVSNFSIPGDLRAKLEELQILTGNPAKDERVLRAIASRDLSQSYGAANHVERTFESCSDPKSVFLFQLPQQQIQKMGPMHPVRTAADFQVPLEAIKKMYPRDWREAAIHYGYSQEAIHHANG